MKIKASLIIGFLLFLLNMATAQEISKEYMYKRITGDKTNIIKVSFRKDGNQLTEMYSRDNESWTIMMTPNNTMFWGENKNGVPFKAVYNNGRIILNHNGRKKIFDVEHPWVQSFNFGFIPFILGKEKKIVFTTLRPTDFKSFEMTMEKEEYEDIKIGNKVYKTVKVEVSLTGFLSLFWSAEYWYRLEDGIMVKYEAVEGGPGTPKTTVTLLKESQNGGE